MTARIFAGFPGIGKSYFAAASNLKVADSDSSLFSWLAPGERHPGFPWNYIGHIETIRDDHDIVLVSTHHEVRDALVECRYHFVAVHPDPSAKDEYLERYVKRGSPDSFIELLDKQWYNWIAELEQQPGCDRVVLEPGEYLGDWMKRGQ